MAFALAHSLYSKSVRTAQRYRKAVSIVQKQKRYLNLHEYSAKELMARHNVVSNVVY